MRVVPLSSSHSVPGSLSRRCPSSSDALLRVALRLWLGTASGVVLRFSVAAAAIEQALDAPDAGAGAAGAAAAAFDLGKGADGSTSLPADEGLVAGFLCREPVLLESFSDSAL